MPESFFLTEPSMTAPLGPRFQLIEETTWEALAREGRQAPFQRPVLVKGGLRHWPAAQWSFESLAQLQNAHGRPVTTKFTDGLVEQGVTQGRPFLPVEPYLHELTQAEQAPEADTGLLPLARRRQLAAGESFHLDWAYMQSFQANRLYLAQWDILKQFPQLRRDFTLGDLWPGRRWTWEFVFIGPARTVTGLHNDFPHNWFCQLRGVKEFILFPPDQSPYMCPAQKYDWGATLSDINISRLPEQPSERARFEQASGLYARVEAGDALFIPKRTWHSVVALQPSISLGVFGLTAGEVLTGGAWATWLDTLHHLHLYRWGNCTCHRALQVR